MSRVSFIVSFVVFALVTVSSNEPNSPTEIPVHGEVTAQPEPGLVAAPNPIEFGSVPLNTPKTIELGLFNDGMLDLNITAISSDLGTILAILDPATDLPLAMPTSIVAGETENIKLLLTPDLVGFLQGNLVIVSDLPTPFPPVAITASVDIPDIRIEPTEVIFEKIIGSSANSAKITPPTTSDDESNHSASEISAAECATDWVNVKLKPGVMLDQTNNNSMGTGTIVTSSSSINQVCSTFQINNATTIFQSTREPLNNIYKFHFNSTEPIETVLAALNNNPDVEWAELDHINKINVTPNDPDFSLQWHHPKTSAMTGWDLQRGNSNIIIAISDTGVDYNHPDLASKMWNNPGEIPGNNIDDDGNGFVDDVMGYDFVQNDGDPMDGNKHGTHCAGISAAATDNSIGIAGVAWNAQIMAVQGLDASGGGYDSDLAAGIEYAANNGADIISMSWGSSAATSVIETALLYAQSLGVVLIAAAGNDNTSTVHYPSGYPMVMAIAASDQNDNRASFSNYGSWVDVAAPGVDIHSTLLNGSYGPLSGTSMATPLVSGLAALLLSQNPTLTPDEVRSALIDSADDVGWMGRVNVATAITSVSSIVVFNDGPGLLEVSSIVPENGSTWIAVGTSQFTVPAGESAPVPLSVDQTGLSIGTYSDRLLVSSNDPDETPYPDAVFVTLNVTNETPNIVSLTADMNPINEDQSAVLSAIANDADGHSLTYEWSTEAGQITADPNDPSSATYTPPDVNREMAILVSLTVRDDFGGVDQTSIGVAVKPVGAAISLDYPNGGELFTADSTDTITWVSSGSIDAVKIVYSVDGGSSFHNVITDNAPNDGSYLWTVTGPNSTAVKIGLIGLDADGEPLTFDASDENLSIEGATELDAPLGLKVTGGSGFVEVSWESVAGATGHKIYRRAGHEPGYHFIAELGTELNYRDETAHNGDTYLYAVAAHSSTEISHISAPIKATPPFVYTQTDTQTFFYGSAQLDSVDAEPGDLVGAFVPEVGCVGMFRITPDGTSANAFMALGMPITINMVGNYGAMSVYGDDDTTTEKDGAVAGDLISFKIWDRDVNQIYGAISLGPAQAIWADKAILNVDLNGSSEQSITLNAGWNLISFSVNKVVYEGNFPDANIAPGVEVINVGELGFTTLLDWFSSKLHPISATATQPILRRVISFDRNGAHVMDSQVPSFVNTLKYMSTGYGYWVKLENNDGATLKLYGARVSPTIALELNAGWNLIGCPLSRTVHYDSTNAPDATLFPPEVDTFAVATPSLVDVVFGSIAGKYRRITGFGSTGAVMYDTNVPAFVNTLHHFGPGYGYWIKMHQPAFLVLPDESGSTTSSISVAMAPPEIPPIEATQSVSTPEPTPKSMFVYGKAFVDGRPIEKGKIITVSTAVGKVVGKFTVNETGKFGAIPIYGHGSESQENSETLYFSIDGLVASPSEPVTFAQMEFIQLDLTLETSSNKVPDRFSLLQNYPNPFNPETWIPFELPKNSNVTIRIYDGIGNLVSSLQLGRKSAGEYLDRDVAAHWDGRNNRGEKVSSGIYFYSIEAEGFSETRPMVILK